MLTLLVALLLGWRSSLQLAKRQEMRQAIQLQYAERELVRARNDLEARPRQDNSRVLWAIELDGISRRK